MKKLVLAVMALMVFILPLTMTYNQQQASANIISKPLTITAKKVAKDLAQDSAVAMANEIVSQYLVRELIDGANVDDGYAAVCMDGSKDNLKDCPTDKRAQVKQNLSSSDKSKLASTVETVLEKKTNTSAKWQKFLDFFVPIFLISGLVATFDAMLDGDSESLIDEVAQQALIDAGLLKPLVVSKGEPEQVFDFTPYVSEVIYQPFLNNFDGGFNVEVILKPDAQLTFKHIQDDGTWRSYYFSSNFKVGVVYYVGSFRSGDDFFASISKPILTVNSSRKNGSTEPVYRGSEKHKTGTLASEQAKSLFPTVILSPISSQTTVNGVLNAFIGLATVATPVEFEVPKIAPPPVETDYGTQTGLEKTKNPDGTKTLPGVDSFTYTYNNTYVYPATDSTTGWKDKTTGEDITVVEDDVVVDDGTTPTDPETPPGEEETPNTDKDKDKIKDKSRDWSGLLTDKFPFSLPWDFLHLMGFLFADPMTPKWEIRGTEKIPLNFTIDLKFFDPYAPWFRTFIFISFVVSVIFMHGRFMGGSK